MAVIPAPVHLLIRYYPARPKLTPELLKFMKSISGTPCCVQISHSLNMAGQLVPRSYKGGRRDNSRIRIKGRDYYYVLAVDEMEKYLTEKYGAPENVSVDADAHPRAPKDIKDYLQGRTGVLVFRNSGFGLHTEIWDGQQIVQRDMNEHALFSQHRVLFWDCAGGTPALDEYMQQQK
jgi:Type VI secretion system (T6SS), amidase effector protein 4